MKVSRVDISHSIESACQQLKLLQKKIGEEVGYLSDEELKSLISVLQKASNHLATEIGQSIHVVAFDSKLKTTLFDLIHAIQRSPAFSQALGAHQKEVLGMFRRIETSIQKAEQKVQKVDSEPLRGG
jgi:hypothetical protein